MPTTLGSDKPVGLGLNITERRDKCWRSGYEYMVKCPNLLLAICCWA